MYYFIDSRSRDVLKVKVADAGGYDVTGDVLPIIVGDTIPAGSIRHVIPVDDSKRMVFEAGNITNLAAYFKGFTKNMGYGLIMKRTKAE